MSIISEKAPANTDYVPVKDWPDVTRMVAGFGDPDIPASTRLEGATLVVDYENGETTSYSFADGDASWETREPDASATSGGGAARVVEVRPDIFFIDFVTGSGAHGRDTSLIVNRSDGRVTAAHSFFVDCGGAVRMQTDFLSGRIPGTGSIEPRRHTSELVGKRIYYRYSPTEHYEHVYLNAGTFVWHCVKGGEAGLADADPIQVLELADGIVILQWSETVMPVESVLTIDLMNKRSIGRMFCWDGPTLAPVHIPFDSRLTVLSETTYPNE